MGRKRRFFRSTLAQSALKNIPAVLPRLHCFLVESYKRAGILSELPVPAWK